MNTKIGYVLQIGNTQKYLGVVELNGFTHYVDTDGVTDETLFFDTPDTAIRHMSVVNPKKDFKPYDIPYEKFIIETVLLNLDESWTKLIKWITKK